jgi:thiamine pyrophosphokinase
MVDDYSRIIPLKNEFTKWYTQGSILSLMPVGTVTGIKTSGLKYNLNDEELQIGYRSGSSNEAETDGFVTISYKTGDMLLMECND